MMLKREIYNTYDSYITVTRVFYSHSISIILLKDTTFIMNTLILSDQQLEYLQDLVLSAYSLDVPEQKDWDIPTFDGLVDVVCGDNAQYL